MSGVIGYFIFVTHSVTSSVTYFITQVNIRMTRSLFQDKHKIRQSSAVSLTRLHISKVIFMALGLLTSLHVHAQVGETENITVATSSSTSTQTVKPNILIFLVDDMGLMDTSVAFIKDKNNQPSPQPLNQFYRTPNMERLASTGARFSDAYAMSVCSPSRASLMTGQNAARHHTTQWIDPFKNNGGDLGPKNWNWQGLTENSFTMAKMLQQQGYTTIHAGKGHFSPKVNTTSDTSNKKVDSITRIGFDINIAGSHIGRPASYYGTDDFGHKLKKERQLRAVPGLSQYHGKDIYLTEAITLAMKKALTTAVSGAKTRNKPFFAYMSQYAVHAPFQADDRFIKNYRTAQSNSATKNVEAFATMVEGMDKSLGDLLDHLNDLGVAENTLIVFIGDNGSDAPLGISGKNKKNKIKSEQVQNQIKTSAPLRGKKGSAWEGGTRVPFILSWVKPNTSNTLQQRFPIAKGSFNTNIVSITDILPTLQKIAGGNIPHTIDGTSLWPLVNSAAVDKTSAAYRTDFLMHFPHEHRNNFFTSLRSGDWKVIYNYKEQNKYQLFNLVTDLSESKNLAKSEPKKLNELLEKMVETLTDMDAQYPLVNKRNGVAEQIINPK